MKTINFYSVEIVLKKGLLMEVGNKFNVIEIDILAENKYRYCLNDLYFSTVEKTIDDYHSCINKEKIKSFVDNTCYGTSVNYELYTFKNKKWATIKKQIAGYISNKYCFFSNVNLDFLDD